LDLIRVVSRSLSTPRKPMGSPQLYSCEEQGSNYGSEFESALGGMVGKNVCCKLLLSTAALVIMAACGGGSTFNVQNPPPPVLQAVTIDFQPAPPTSIQINATAQATAVVQNDSSNAGVDWSLTCAQVGNCGSLSSLHTGSGQAVIYSPPNIISGNNQKVS